MTHLSRIDKQQIGYDPFRDDSCIAPQNVTWERRNKSKKWCPYSSIVSQLIEQSYQRNLTSVWLGDADVSLKLYTVNLKDLTQISEATGTKCPVRRRVDGKSGAVPVQSKAIQTMWEWHGDSKHSWHHYKPEVAFVVEEAYKAGDKIIDLSKKFPRFNYTIDFDKMMQINNYSHYHRPIRRVDGSVVPSAPSPDDNSFTNGAYAIPSNLYPSLQNVQNDDVVADTQYALVGGKPWTYSSPPHTSHSEIKPVPGIEPLPDTVKRSRKKKKNADPCEEPFINIDVLSAFTEEIPIPPQSQDEQLCIICQEDLHSGSSYDNDTTLVRLKLCSHIFHKSCLKAMYESGTKNHHIQCPTCKTIHGIKFGTQPPGKMIYHVLPYSLPGFPDRDTIQIIYDIKPGVQGPEHPHPGKRYSARGFPRHCYLPDNEIGRKILRLLIKAWERRLIFTIGTSSTTGEVDTVTWNEIHHKTEFGYNKHGHGYPDPSYFENVIAELAAHGVLESPPTRNPVQI